MSSDLERRDPIKRSRFERRRTQIAQGLDGGIQKLAADIGHWRNWLGLGAAPKIMAACDRNGERGGLSGRQIVSGPCPAIAGCPPRRTNWGYRKGWVVLTNDNRCGECAGPVGLFRCLAGVRRSVCDQRWQEMA
jgi:hypothetical protein